VADESAHRVRDTLGEYVGARAPSWTRLSIERMREIVESHGGTVEKFIGDAVMALFGVPQVHEEDALRAVRAVVFLHRSPYRDRARGPRSAQDRHRPFLRR
jgi:class 3 adenylate cyclase